MTTTGGYQLSTDLVMKAVHRLGWVGLIYSATYLVIYLVSRYVHRNEADLIRLMPFFDGCLVASALLGVGIFAVARSRKLPPLVMLDVGLFFEAAGALLISLAETVLPIPPDYHIRGHSAIAIWVVFFALLVPVPTGRAALSAFTTAAMGPLGMAVNIVVNGLPIPTMEQWLMFYSSAFIMAGWSVVLSRYLYRMGAQMTRARELGSYELVELIGRGGMGEVWKARHRLLVHNAAVKLIRPEALCCESEEQILSARRRFEREAQATAALHSPHTVALHDYGVSEDDTFYYVMELLEGLDLETFVQRFGPQPPARVVYWLRQVCDSLAEAHAAGIIHRDIKPKNIFVCKLGLNYDFVKVLDFGLVKLRGATDQSRLTRDGITAGTPGYMSPEMAMGHFEVDARTDLYALGCVGYWLLAGQLVFEASNPLAMALEHVRSKPVPLSQRSELEIPPDLEQVILRCLEKDPNARPQTARELSRLLAACQLEQQWDSEKAEEWWQTHLPGPALPAPVEPGVAATTDKL